MIDKMPEVWIPIIGWESSYEVTNAGKVRNKNTLREFKGFIDTNGYHCVLLSKRGKVFARKVHRLVIETFIPEKPDGHVVNHVDGCKTNNNLNNLEYVTQRENVCHGKSIKGMVGTTFFKPMGKWQSRIEIKGKRKFLGYFSTQKEAHNAYLDAVKENGHENKYAR